MLDQTGWLCPKCGYFNTGTSICARCGEELIRLDPVQPKPRWDWGNRAKEDQVARILGMIAIPPNRRQHPQSGDLIGEFDEWFDGGALRFVTGYTEYEFSDGSRATVDVLPYLSILIELSNGERVSVCQEHQ